MKPSYSHEEFKSLMFHFIKQAQDLKADNKTLQSSSVAMKKGIESLQHGKAGMTLMAQKDQRIEAIRQNGCKVRCIHHQTWVDKPCSWKRPGQQCCSTCAGSIPGQATVGLDRARGPQVRAPAYPTLAHAAPVNTPQPVDNKRRRTSSGSKGGP